MSRLPDDLPASMHAAVLYGKEDVQLERLPVPRPGPGELLLRVRAALTCGTDLKVFRRGYHAAMITPPSVFGHEMAGDVVANGPTDGPAAFPLGTRVVVANSAPCDACYFCERGQENLCENLQFLNGAYAEYLRVPARFVQRNTWVIPEQLSYEAAALAEPLACVVHGLDETGLRKCDKVVVVGLGPIGLMFVALLKARGLYTVGVGRQAPRLAAARRLGADRVIEADREGCWREELKAFCPRPDVVIEATGRPDVWELALGLVRRGGTVNLFGGCPAGTSIRVDTQRLHYDQVRVISPFHHRPQAFRRALEALANGSVPHEPFIGDQRLLHELPGLLKEMLQANRTVKTLIRP